MSANVFVEWMEDGRLLRGLLKKEDKAKLQVETLTGKTVSVALRRCLLKHTASEAAGGYFAEIDRRAEEVDLELLHGSLQGGGAYTLKELAVLWLSKESPSAADLSVMLSACAGGAPWFRVEASGGVRVATEEEMAQRRRAQEAAVQRAEAAERLDALLREGLSGRLEASVLAKEPAAGVHAAMRAYFLGAVRAPDHLPGLKEALERAARREGVREERVARTWLERQEDLPAPYATHMERFHRTFLGAAPPQGARLGPCEDLHPEAPDEELARLEEEAAAAARALPSPLNGCIFSVDDEGVQEIDDALSVEPLDGGRFRVGVHIAAPGLFLAEEGAIHTAACSRCTTVYQPDLKWTMLPPRAIRAFSLKAGCTVPAVSTYYTFSLDDFSLREAAVRLEALRVEENLSYDALERFMEGVFAPGLEGGSRDAGALEAFLARDPRALEWSGGALPGSLRAAFDWLVPLARSRFAGRVREGAAFFLRKEYRIKVSSPENILIEERRRNGLAEGVVTEMMILNNGWTARRLADAGLPAIYRTQRPVVVQGASGETRRMQTDLTVVPRGHAGLGSALYCWSTSPLRRYADLLNQRQVGSLAEGKLSAFTDESELLVRAKKTEFQGVAADRHQRRIEQYWVLKRLQQNPGEPHPVSLTAHEGKRWLHFDHLPLRIPWDAEAAMPKGPLHFIPERFDFYELTVEGKLA